MEEKQKFKVGQLVNTGVGFCVVVTKEEFRKQWPTVQGGPCYVRQLSTNKCYWSSGKDLSLACNLLIALLP